MMRTRKLVWLTAAAGVAAALQIAALARQDKAAEIMAETRKAIGGKKLEGMQTFSAQAKVQRNVGEMQIGGDVEFLLEMPDKFLQAETRTGGALAITTATGFNGAEMLSKVDVPGMAGRGGVNVMMAGPGGAMLGRPDMTPEQHAEMSATMVRNTRQSVSRLMLGWFGTTHPTQQVEYTYVGEAESPDGRAHVIDVKGADDFAARVFIDQDTNLPLMLTYKAPRMRMMTQRAGAATGGGIQVRQGGQISDEDRQKMMAEVEKMRQQPPELIEYSLFFSDWKDADGIKFPHTIQRAAAGTTDEEWTFSRARVNPKIDAKKFEPESK